MSSLVHQLGLSKSVAFHDVYSIDDADLLAFVPRPAYALLLVFPVSNTYEKFRMQEDSGKEDYSGFGPDEEVIWFKQTIGNACGLIGLLHGVSNGAVKKYIGTLFLSSFEKHLLMFAITKNHNQTLKASSSRRHLSSQWSEPISCTSPKH